MKTRAGVTSYTYDSVSMMDSHHKFPSTWRMIYGPDDERIGVVQESGLSRWKIRDFGGKVLREYRSDDIGMEGIWFWMKDYVHADGRVIGTERMNHFGGKRHFHTDHLGSVRMITDQSRYRISVHEYRPFGVEQTDATQEFNNFYDFENPSVSAGDVAADAMKFTGHERDFRGWLNVDNDEYLDYMHARYYDPNLGRFLSVDPVIGKAAMRSPQLWNRYAYVGNNPLKFTDPTGRVLQLSGCVKEQSSDACKGQMNLYLSTFGNQSADAGKYLQVGKNGIVSFNGISGAAFAARFGQMGQATNYLVSNNAAMFTMMTGRSGKTIGGRGAYFAATEVSTLFHGKAYPGGGEIGIDTGAFPQNFFGVTSSATEALVHEIGHAVGSLFPGYASSVDAMAAGSSLMQMGSTGRMEAYATSFENAWRRGVLGASTLRRGYFYDGDVRDIGNTPLFP